MENEIVDAINHLSHIIGWSAFWIAIAIAFFN